MIIPPLALAFGAVVVVVKLLISGQISSSNEEEMTLKSERAEPKNSQLVSNCRFRSDKVPHRDLSSTSEVNIDNTPINSDQRELRSNKTNDSGELRLSDEAHADQSEQEAEAPEDTDP